MILTKDSLPSIQRVIKYEDGEKRYVLYLNYNQINEINEGTFDSLTNLTFLDLSNNQINEIKVKTFDSLTNLTSLFLNNNQINEIKVKTFDSLTNLTYLDLSNNQINEINEGTFDSLTDLTGLYLKNNQIIEIKVKTFDSLTNLTYLDLSNNQINEINEGTFDSLTDLTGLYLKNNQIIEIKVKTFDSLTNLTFLDLSNNQINEIKEKTFDSLKKLNELYLNYNQINEIKEKTFDSLTNLTFLDLSNNQINEIKEKTFDSLKKLNELYLNYNQINEIKEKTFDSLTNLTFLDLSNNQINEIKEKTFDSLKKLNELYLNYNQINEIKVKTFDSLTNLTFLDLSDNQINEINEGTFDSLTDLTGLYLKNNQIIEIKVKTFDSLTNLTYLDLSNNQINEINEGTFDSLTDLTGLYLKNNQIIEIKVKTFDSLKKLNELYLNYNQINEIKEKTFDSLTNLTFLDLSNNQINEIKEKTFDSLTNLTRLYLKNNQINEIKVKTFDSLTNLTFLDLSDNQINEIKEGTFNKLKTLFFLDLNNNQINKIHKDIFKNVNTYCFIDFKDNFQINDMDFIFEFLFKIKNLREIENCLDDKFIAIYENHDQKNKEKGFFLIKNSQDDYESRIFAFYLNLSTFYVRDIHFSFGILTYETVLDFMITYSSMIDNSFILNFKNYIENYLKQNKQIQNLEFKLKSPKCLEYIIYRDNLLLFETFFKLEINNDGTGENEYIFDQDEFYLGINVDKCFDKVLEKNNEKMGIYLFRMISFIFKKYENQKERIDILFKNFNEKLIKTYLKQVIKKRKWYNLTKEILDLSKQSEKDESTIFLALIENETKLVDQNSNNCSESKSESKISSYIQKFTKLIRCNKVDLSPNEVESVVVEKYPNNVNQIEKDDDNDDDDDDELDGNLNPLTINNGRDNFIAKNEETYDKYEENILKLINKTKNFDLLSHRTTQQILDEKYKYLPSFIYHSKLTLLLLFLIFYSIHISIYYMGDTNSADLRFKSTIICYIILSIFIIIELSQFIYSFFVISFVTYLRSFKNIIELVDFPLCILTLSLEDSDSKSSLFSATILMSYCVFILNLDKFFGVGPFVNVFGKIIIRAYKLFLILLVILAGFLLSFKNRSNYYLQLKNNNQTFDKNNEITAFEGDFANNFFNIIMMAIGIISPTGMGITNLNAESLIDFLIYGIFIFIMPILFINIFTGIAIDEIRQLVDNSKVEIISTKIEFVYQIEPYREYLFFKKFESLLKLIDESFGKMKKKIKKFNYLTKAIENFRKTKLEKEEKEEIDEIKDILIEQEDKISKLLNELKQNSSLMQSQFNFIDKSNKKLDKKMNNMDKKMNNMDKKMNNMDKKMNNMDKKMNNMEEQIKKVNKTELAAGTSK
jgi:Leucine-rich repeat (LRR) protein